jgi:hypothetical protein
MAAATKWLSRHVPMATDMHATIEELLETVFSTQSVLRCYKQATRLELNQSRVRERFRVRATHQTSSEPRDRSKSGSGVICCVYYKIGFVLNLQKLNCLPDKSATPGLDWN